MEKWNWDMAVFYDCQEITSISYLWKIEMFVEADFTVIDAL
jgi:hypothetical protein